ncbi:ROK family protein [Geomonas ferrireducens]|uniref:ROK family protein n=1 Tax=Geomonas ferrireducens TaxID=2570227 RepID=UPI0010A7C4FF|nr:ROK family protein [Geomonas ferrireducens]
MKGKGCIGIDIGGTNLRLALVDQEGRVLARNEEATLPAAGLPFLLSRLEFALEGLRETARSAGMEVVAVGAGVPGLVGRDGVVRASVNIPALEEVRLGEEIEKTVGLPVLLVNDANACAVAEHRFGAGRGCSSLLVVTLGTGIGAGLILDGRLWTGADGAAGELGHVPVEPLGRPCGCGARGCLEQYASATAISGGSGDAEAVAAMARGGDAGSLTLFAEAGRYLGIAAAGVVNLLNLEAVILAGGVSGSFELLEPSLRRELSARSIAVPGARVRILKGSLGNDAGVLGAAALACSSLPL